jgi:hypothetical protein
VHGSSYFAMRNEALDANTFTNKFRGAPRAIDRLFDYAFSFGSPIYIPKVYNGKNRSFFYTTYERYKQRAIGPGAPTQSFTTPDEYAGNFRALLGRLLRDRRAGQPGVPGSDLRSVDLFPVTERPVDRNHVSRQYHPRSANQ